MLFNSLGFLIFFPVVTGLYFALPYNARWFLLLTASCIFYMSFIPAYLLILALTILVDYFAGIWIEQASSQRRKRTWLIVSIISTCSILFVFKYFNFFNANLTTVATLLHWNYSLQSLSLILPIGLSFHTFQSMSYVIEVYRGKQAAEHNFGIYALYVMFYPQLVAGPIERPQNLLHQFNEKHDFDYSRVADGLKLMLWGFFKKIVLADNIALVVNAVYNQPTNYTGVPLIFATVLFAFQIYCDFSGYSDIAIGSAQVMGFRLMTNFRRPYLSWSVAEFWKRWHISLSTWFKDYLYVPLGGNRVPVARWCVNLLIVFLVSGLWHGANWTFVVWGTLHGTYLAASILTEKARKGIVHRIGIDKIPYLHTALKICVTFTLVDIGWVFFRANSLSDAWYILTHLFSGLSLDFGGVDIGTNWNGIITILCALAFMECVHLWQEHRSVLRFVTQRSVWVRWSIYLTLIWAIILLGAQSSNFIYFQF